MALVILVGGGCGAGITEQSEPVQVAGPTTTAGLPVTTTSGVEPTTTSSTAPAEPADPVSAGDATTDVNQARFVIVAEVTGARTASGTGTFGYRIAGAMNGDRLEAVADTSSFADYLDATGENFLGTDALGPPQMYSQAMRTPTELVIDGDDVYLRSPLANLMFGDPTAWVHGATSSVVEDGDISAGPVALPVDPILDLARLARAGAGLPATGEEEVAGVPTIRYEGPVGVDVLEQADPGEFTGADAEVSDVGLAVWVGDDAMVHRVRLSFTASGEDPDAGSMGVTITAELSGIGEDVPIDLPDPSDVVEQEDFDRPLG